MSSSIHNVKSPKKKKPSIAIREIVGVAIGARAKATARRLWASLLPVYRQCAVCYSDFWETYAAILPTKRHRAVGKDSGQTRHIERVNNTLR